MAGPYKQYGDFDAFRFQDSLTRLVQQVEQLSRDFSSLKTDYESHKADASAHHEKT